MALPVSIQSPWMGTEVGQEETRTEELVCQNVVKTKLRKMILSIICQLKKNTKRNKGNETECHHTISGGGRKIYQFGRNVSPVKS